MCIKKRAARHSVDMGVLKTGLFVLTISVIVQVNADECLSRITSSCLANPFVGQLRRFPVPAILMYVPVHCGYSAPCASQFANKRIFRNARIV